MKLARSGGELWGAYSAKVGTESAVFLQRFLPEPAGEPVIVSEPGAKPEDPRLFVSGSDLVVLYWEDDAGQYAVRKRIQAMVCWLRATRWPSADHSSRNSAM